MSPVFGLQPSNQDKGHQRVPGIQEFSKIPLEHTPDAQPTFYEGILSIWGFGDAWGMLQGYVGVLLEGM